MPNDIDEQSVQTEATEDDEAARIAVVRELSTVEEIIEFPEEACDVLQEFFDCGGLEMVDTYERRPYKTAEPVLVSELITLGSMGALPPAVKACASRQSVDFDVFNDAYTQVNRGDESVSDLTKSLVSQLEASRAQAVKTINAREKDNITQEFASRLRLIVWYHIFEGLAELAGDEPNGNGHTKSSGATQGDVEEPAA